MEMCRVDTRVQLPICSQGKEVRLAMNRIPRAVYLCMVFAFVGCRSDEPPSTEVAKPIAEAPVPESEYAPKPKAETEPAIELPEYSDEEIAAAKQMASDLGVVVKEDADGNVSLVDTAAGRSWVDDYQMEVRFRPLPDNLASTFRVIINEVDTPSAGESYQYHFNLLNLEENEWTTLSVPLANPSAMWTEGGDGVPESGLADVHVCT